MRRCAAAAAAAARGSTRAIRQWSWPPPRSAWSRRSPTRCRSPPPPLCSAGGCCIIAALDLEHHWLPDALTLPLVPAGLAAAWAGLGPPLAERAAGAAIGWAALAAIAFLYRRWRGREGMGGGDPKLMAALGAWVGAWQLPVLLLGAGLTGLAAVLAMRLKGAPVAATSRLPLGTLLALAAWPVWLIVAA